MSTNTYFRFVAFSTVAAVLLAIVTLLFMNRLSSVSFTADRDRFLVLYAESIEEQIGGHVDLTEIENPLLRPPPRPGHKPPRGPPRFDDDDPPPPHDFNSPKRPPRRLFRRAEFWLVDERGEVLFSSRGIPLPIAWKDLPRPEITHEVMEKADFFRVRSGFQIVRMDHSTPLYLIAKDPERPSFLHLFATQAIVIFLTVTLAFLTSIFFLFVYLRRNAEKARSVLRSLGQGDLTVRFQLKKFDEFGGLLGEFNQMADQIQHLVEQIHFTEQTRKNLLQELGHDLRTPLTALRAATETLKLHNCALNEQDRADLLNMIEQESIYFGQLLENLLEVASIDEPQFKANTTYIDLSQILNQQIHRKRISSKKNWSLEFEDNLRQEFPIQGNLNLVERLISNGLNNAEKFANQRIEVKLKIENESCVIQIVDDGPGLGESQLEGFGTRKPFKNRNMQNGHPNSLSLGSVIMKSIAENHKGSVTIENQTLEGKTVGACLTIRLPMA